MQKVSAEVSVVVRVEVGCGYDYRKQMREVNPENNTGSMCKSGWKLSAEVRCGC